jgi:SCP-2 sterol transfer family
VSRLIAKVAAVAIRRRFDSTQANGLEATIGLRLRVRARSIDLAIAIAGGECTIKPGATPAAGAPGACATISLADLIRLALGDAAWPQLLSSGRLELSGDPFVAMRLPALFRMLATTGRGRTAPAPITPAR